MSDIKKRLIAAAAFALLLGTEIIIGRFAHGFIRAYIGDVLVIPLIYCFVRIFYVGKNRLLPLFVGSLGIIAEGLQYFDLCGLLGIEKNSILGIMLGSHADLNDIICYAVGTALIYITQVIIAKFICRRFIFKSNSADNQS